MMTSPRAETKELLRRLGVPVASPLYGVSARSPISGATIAWLCPTDLPDICIGRAEAAFKIWRAVPPPQRGEFVRLLGEELRDHKRDLGMLVTIETGKIYTEGLGEIQEMIDICDFAVGLSRQLYGRTIASERFEHRMMETWHPLGVCGVISAWNFPAAVWAWNAALAFVCGNSVVWKPSPKAPLTAIAIQTIVKRVIDRCRAWAPDGLSEVMIGEGDGRVLVADSRVPLVSATGSTEMGRQVAPVLAARFSRAILELGGNNAAIVTPTADLKLALRAVAFAAMGTAGQRCTTLRRLFVHDSIYSRVIAPLTQVYDTVVVGDPRKPETQVGPLVDGRAFAAMQDALRVTKMRGGMVYGGKRVFSEPEAFYVRPALCEMPEQIGPMLQETFAPILYVMRYSRLDEAIELQNAVGAGLASSIFTNDVREAEQFVSVVGSDCGIANVNIGPSGAEIGGAFGGEKETGGGREAGSDAWKGYMRRQTTTVNFSAQLPLAQGVEWETS